MRMPLETYEHCDGVCVVLSNAQEVLLISCMEGPFKEGVVPKSRSAEASWPASTSLHVGLVHLCAGEDKHVRGLRSHVDIRTRRQGPVCGAIKLVRPTSNSGCARLYTSWHAEGLGVRTCDTFVTCW